MSKNQSKCTDFIKCITIFYICDDPQKKNTLEAEGEMVTTTAVSPGLTLEIQDFAHGSAQVVGASILLKNENDLNKTNADVSLNTIILLLIINTYFPIDFRS